MQALASCATAALMGAAVAAPSPLALTEAQRLAIERSPQIAAYDAAIAASRDRAAAAAQPPERTFKLGVAQPLASREKREALAEWYAREADRAAARKIATEVDIARETALAWLECYYVEQMTRVAADQLKSAQAEVEGAEHMYWAGRLTQAEFYGTRSMLVMVEDKSSELEHRSRAARIALKRWVGDAGDAPLAPPPNIDRIRLAPAAVEGDLARHPQVALLEKEAEIAASDVRLPVSTDHMGNFFESVRTRKPPICDAEIGHRSATVCHLAGIALRLGRKLRWDPAKEEFVGDREANAQLAREQRKPWTYETV